MSPGRGTLVNKKVPKPKTLQVSFYYLQFLFGKNSNVQGIVQISTSILLKI